MDGRNKGLIELQNFNSNKQIKGEFIERKNSNEETIMFRLEKEPENEPVIEKKELFEKAVYCISFYIRIDT